MSALRPVTLVVGHYGVGKTNFAVNLALDLASAGNQVTVVDLDIVNPYFRASEQRRLFEEHGVELVAPVFAEVGSSLDVPSLTGKVAPSIEMAGEGRYTIIDVGGDDAGSIALGRYARIIDARDYAMLCVLNKFRNLVQGPQEALENLHEIEAACRLKATSLVSNAHLKDETSVDHVVEGRAYAEDVARLSGLPLVCMTAPSGVSIPDSDDFYHIKPYVKSPWE